jgi:hypothetical protein
MPLFADPNENSKRGPCTYLVQLGAIRKQRHFGASRPSIELKINRAQMSRITYYIIDFKILYSFVVFFKFVLLTLECIEIEEQIT